MTRWVYYSSRSGNTEKLLRIEMSGTARDWQRLQAIDQHFSEHFEFSAFQASP